MVATDEEVATASATGAMSHAARVAPRITAAAVTATATQSVQSQEVRLTTLASHGCDSCDG